MKDEARHAAITHPRGLRSNANLSVAFAVICFVIFLIPYAGYFFLGPPAALGSWFAVSALRRGDRRARVLGALVVNAAALAFAVLAATMLAGWVD